MHIRALMVIVALQLTGCGGQERIEGKRFDFLANINRAEIICQGAPVLPRTFLGTTQPWTEEDRLFCPAPPRTTLRYRGVSLGRGGVLHLGLCLKPGSALPAGVTGEALFSVELIAGHTPINLFEVSLPVTDLEPGKVIEYTVAVPEVEALSGEFIFRSDTSANKRVSTMWCGLALVSEGRPAVPQEASLSYHKEQALLLDQPHSFGEGRSFRADYREEEKLFKPAKDGRLLIQSGTSKAVYTMNVTEDLLLSFGIASLNPESEMFFQVIVDGHDRFKRKFESTQRGVSKRSDVNLKAKDGATTIELSVRGTGTAVWIYPALKKMVHVPRQRSEEGKNVILMVVDALRADRLGCYGAARDTSPHVDRLAEKGVLFANARAQSSWTIPSTATVLTGQYSYTHGLYDAYHWYLVPGIDTITQAFLDAGFSTTAFVSNHLVSEDNNFTKGFKSFHEIPFSSAAQMNRAFLNWIDGECGERFFAYLHYMDPHLPYAAPGKALNRFDALPLIDGEVDPDRSDSLVLEIESDLKTGGSPSGSDVEELLKLYDSAVAYWDVQLGLLIEALRERGLFENTVIVITSDHGEEFLEHGMLRHGQSLFDELLHVPLIVVHSGRPSSRREEAVGLLDIAPTLLELSGISIAPYRFAGHNLFSGKAGHDHLFAETAHGLDHPGSPMKELRAVLTREWKAVVTPGRDEIALFNRLADPGEKNDLSKEHPDVADLLEISIREWVKRSRERAPYNISLFDASALEELKRMGYVK